MTRIEWYSRCAKWGQLGEVVVRVSRDEWVCELTEPVYVGDDVWMTVDRLSGQLEASGLLVRVCR